MFGRYALPSDDKAGTYTSITGSAEDPEYPAENLVATSTTGHLNQPSRPAKLTTGGFWELTFSGAITVEAAALIYHDLDQGDTATLSSGGFSQAFTIQPKTEDGWTISPWMEFDPVSGATWRLTVGGAASVGRLLLIGTLRQLVNDVRWGVEETEDHRFLGHTTDFGVETLYDIGGKQRAFSGEFAVEDARVVSGGSPGETFNDAAELITLHRSAHGRVQPWLLIPDQNVNDAWLVRFEDPHWTRRREMPNVNIFPYRVREVARGLPFP